MKFSTLAVIVPLVVAAQARAFAIPDLASRANKGAAAAKGKAVNAAGNGSGKAAATTSPSQASSTSTASGATASSDPAFCGSDPQKSLCLLTSQVQTGLEQDGQETPEAGQVPSLTSFNNFINYCATRPDLPLTNGQQVKTGSCNPTPMGVIISQDKMPSCKFQSPKNLDVIQSNTPFTISLAINNLETGNFVSATQNYYAAPAQTNPDGILIGHSHVVIEEIDSLTSTKLTDPTRFAFFKGLNDVAVNGILTADVTGGLPAGVYKMSTINSAANHQPALVAIAQHAALDDAVYFTVSDDPSAVTVSSGSAGSASAAGGSGTSSSTTSSEVASNTGNAGVGAKGGKGGSNKVNTTSSASSAAATSAKTGSKGQVDAGLGASKISKTTASTVAGGAATSAKTDSTGQSGANAGANKNKNSKTTSTAAAAAATTKSSIGGAAGKGQTTVAEPPSCD